ncbi:double-stranded RNA-binding protein 1-like [Lotus japonicus]|uniref:double-stranded RNA-binding protein 1-like n=1 Tax=Lotus japonicus TaxID=34305 RepID=UPI00258F56E5|nr:double-stranded RNA-binding protein 1-like [Lotus japonicus]
MYKTKLQQVCHQRRWSLPKYSAKRDGPDHIPRFKASVIVNGTTFTSPGAFRSSKEAHNQAAMVAFLSFVPAPPGTPISFSLWVLFVSGKSSSTPSTENDTEEEVEAEKPQSISTPAQSPINIDGEENYTVPLGKSHLQNYARGKNLDPPIFTVKTVGLSHDTHFKATVVVDGKSFESPALSKTIKGAQQATSKMALMSLSLDILKKGGSGPFKSLLLELTQREGFCKPIYKTIQSSSSHMRTFYSTVEVEDEEFHGKASKSKKEAEQDAAKIAYIALNECGLHKYTSLSSYLRENKALPSIHNYMETLNHEDELMDLDFNDTLPSSVKVSNEENNPFYLQSTKKSMMSNKAKAPETSSYLLCNKFKVYTSYPNVALPEGTIVLPISDSKWIAAGISK